MTDPAALSPGFEGLVQIMAILRAPDGCPWDREQTHESLLKYLLEESVEVVDAVRTRDDANLAEELGDVLLQVVFHAQLAAERGRFTIDDVVRSISQKMVRRHPHVFGDAVAATADAVKAQWDVIKADEKKGKPAKTLSREAYGQALAVLAAWGRKRGFDAEAELAAARERD
jgi:tetrapyrrole methylase family protein/MazG family protein